MLQRIGCKHVANIETIKNNSMKVASDLSTKIRALSETMIILARKLKWFQGKYSCLIVCKQVLCGMAFLVLLCLKITMTLPFGFKSQIVVLHRPVERRGEIKTRICYLQRNSFH